MIIIVFMISDLPWLMCDNKDSTCCDYDGADVENDDIALALQFPTSDDYDDDDEYDDDDDDDYDHDYDDLVVGHEFLVDVGEPTFSR